MLLVPEQSKQKKSFQSLQAGKSSFPMKCLKKKSSNFSKKRKTAINLVIKDLISVF